MFFFFFPNEKVNCNRECQLQPVHMNIDQEQNIILTIFVDVDHDAHVFRVPDGPARFAR